MHQSNKLIQSLHVDFDNENEIALTRQNTLRRVVGVLGMCLPILLYFSVSWYTGYDKPMQSISHYYYTRFGSIFIIVVSLLSIFLLIYKGKKPIDFYLSCTAGIASLLLLLLPASNLKIPGDNVPPYVVVTVLKEYPLRDILHDIFGGIFFVTLACMALFLFTKKNPDQQKVTARKHMRNTIYIICGLIVLLAIAAIPVAWITDRVWSETHQWTFWMETLALEAFGFSWLVKGETILKDKCEPGKH